MAPRSAPPTNADDGLARPAAWRLLQVSSSLALLIAATYLAEPLHFLQPWKPSEDYVPFWNVVGRHWRGEGSALARQREELAALRQASLEVDVAPTISPAPPAVTSPEFPELVAEVEGAEPTAAAIEAIDQLASYYRRLTLVDLKAPLVARAAHWGDSLLGDDGLTAAIRRRLQARFGDGGHGFHVLATSNPFHMHRDVSFDISSPWATRCEILFRCEADGRYGLGGVSVRASIESASRFATVSQAPGDRFSRLELWYEGWPHGGLFEVRIDDEQPKTVDTRRDETRDEVAVFELEDGPHEVRVRAAGRGSVRGYGVVLERNGPGVVWDNLAIIGLSTVGLDAQNAEHIQDQVRRRQTDLLVFNLGGNDSQRSLEDLRLSYAKDFSRVLRKYRAGRPEASCLVLGVTDHGQRTEENLIRTHRSVPVLVALQREVALAEGCAFFDLFQAMGGEGAIGRWARSKPPLANADLRHPTSAGHEILAALIYRALIDGYVDFRRRMAGQPFPEWEAFRSSSPASPSPH
jgi:lysophospholipase L1-like esterase